MVQKHSQKTTPARDRFKIKWIFPRVYGITEVSTARSDAVLTIAVSRIESSAPRVSLVDHKCGGAHTGKSRSDARSCSRKKTNKYFY